MSVPEYVPISATERVRPAEWEVPPLPTRRSFPRRPAELGANPPPFGRLQGRPAPDAGYALGLARRFADRLHLAAGEDPRDALRAGAMLGIARASRFGRAPVATDVEVGLELLGYLGGAPPDMVAWRRRALQHIRGDLFRQVALMGADRDVLGLRPGELAPQLDRWRSLLPADLPGVVDAGADAAAHRHLGVLLGDGADTERLTRFVGELTDHLHAERAQLRLLPAPDWDVLRRGQKQLLDEAHQLERRRPSRRRDAASHLADLLALQALAEEEALARLARHPGERRAVVAGR